MADTERLKRPDRRSLFMLGPRPPLPSLRLPRSPRGRLLLILPAAALAVVLLWWRGPNWGQVGHSFANVRWEWVGAAVALNLLSVLVRALCWWAILNQALPRRLGYRTVLSGYAVGLMANAILPGRVGELARIAVLRRKLEAQTGLWPRLVGSVVAHRLFDLLPAAALVLWVLLTAKIPSWAFSSLIAIIAIGAALFVIGLISARSPDRRQRIEDLGAIRGAISFTRQGLSVLRAPAVAGVAAFFQLLGWLCQLLAVWAAMRAFHLPTVSRRCRSARRRAAAPPQRQVRLRPAATAPMRRSTNLLRIERHRLGPRIYLLGVRLHEWHLGLAILLGLAAGVATGAVHDTVPTGLAAAAAIWLIAKDWRDLVPRHRDTGAWRLGLHRPPLALRTFRRADPLPALVAAAAAGIGAINLLSALTPNIAWRSHLLLKVEAVAELRVFHALAIPASIALLVSSYYLYRRRLRALYLAVALLLALAVLNLFKGLDFEEAIGDGLIASLLWLGRGSFYVRHEPLGRRAAAVRAPLAAAAGMLISFLLVWAAAPAHASTATVAGETADLLVWRAGPLSFHDEFGP